jgi:uncharacterized membrane protein (Fun14 family)
MSLLGNLITPLTGELGIGVLGGFLVGFALKKVAKIVGMIAGLVILGLWYLSSEGIIYIDENALGISVPGVLSSFVGFQNIAASLLFHAPFSAAFLGGLYLGTTRT